jgi:hypothetical protein
MIQNAPNHVSKNTQHDFLTLENFSPDDHITITAKTFFEATEQFARSIAPIVQQKLKKELSADKKTRNFQKSTDLLARTKKLIQEKVFEIEGVDYLDRYIQTLTAYCKGANISLEEGVFLQSYADIACQTIFVQNEKTHAINLVHIEENPADKNLFTLGTKIEELRQKESYKEIFTTHKSFIDKLYFYKLVTIKTPDAHQMFFAYPGLCTAGPAFGVDFTHKTVFAADTLMPKDTNKPYDTWANAIVSMAFDCGDIALVQKLMQRLEEAHLTVLGGYAFHIASWGDTPTTVSYEFSTEKVKRSTPTQEEDRSIIAQTNYPLSPALQIDDMFEKPSDDPEDAQFSLVIKRRTGQLCATGQKEIYPTTDARADIQKLLTTIASPVGDVETFENGPVFAGFPTIYTAAYMVASFSPKDCHITIGKLTPPPIPNHEYAFQYDAKNTKHQSYVIKDVKQLVAK